jgi:hypothetical protein
VAGDIPSGCAASAEKVRIARNTTGLVLVVAVSIWVTQMPCPEQSINRNRQFNRRAWLLTSPGFLKYFLPVVARVYIVSFRTHDERRPSKFIGLADSMKSAINMAWDHRGPDLQSRFDKSTAQAEEMKEMALRVL